MFKIQYTKVDVEKKLRVALNSLNVTSRYSLYDKLLRQACCLGLVYAFVCVFLSVFVD